MQRLIPALIWLLLSACGSLSKPEPAGDVFALEGRISIKYGEESLSGLLHWQAGAHGDSLLLSSPLGQGLAAIKRDAGGVTLTRAGEPVMQAETVEALTESALGFTLPLSGLRYWMQGQPDPHSNYRIVRDESGQVVQIEQDGWSIEYQDYVDARPHKIRVLRPGLSLRVVVDEWKI